MSSSKVSKVEMKNWLPTSALPAYCDGYSKPKVIWPGSGNLEVRTGEDKRGDGGHTLTLAISLFAVFVYNCNATIN